MFGIVIIDAYRREEAYQMASAIDDICCLIVIYLFWIITTIKWKFNSEDIKK